VNKLVAFKATTSAGTVCLLLWEKFLCEKEPKSSQDTLRLLARFQAACEATIQIPSCL